jgi:uncharacterized membrane protein YbhN (UPF0104 family)
MIQGEYSNPVANPTAEVTRTKGKKRWIRLALRMVGLGLFIWILSRVDLLATFKTLRHVNLWLLTGGILFAIPTVVIRSWRLRLILESFGVRLSMPQALLIRLVGTAAGDMLPGRTGEIVTVAYLQQAGHGLRDPFLTLILDRLFDFVILAVWAIAGLSLIGEKMGGQVNTLEIILIASAIIFSAAILVLLVARSRPGLLGSLMRALVPAHWHGKLMALARGEASRTPGNPVFLWDTALLLKIAAASLFSFIFLILRGFLLARANGIGLSLPFLAACMAITTLLQLIPISNVMGVGTREVSLVYLFGLAGISGEVAIGFSFLIVLALLAQDVVGLLLWWRYPVGTAL